MSDLTTTERRAMQSHARRSLEAVDGGRGAREGESIWHLAPPKWSADTLARLEERGLIEIRREWKNNFVRITESGFDALATTQEGDRG